MKIIGIDLGTTNSVMAVMEGGKPVVIPNAEGERVTPSVVALNPNTGQWMVGTAAKRQAIVNPENTIFSIKRFIERTFSDPSIQHDMKLAPSKIRAANNGYVLVRMGSKWYSPPEISAMILQKLKADAEAYLGEPVTKAVITVPAYFNDCQRQATKDAACIAELEVLCIINEPTAASLAYGLGREMRETIAVYHLGGGTFGISIVYFGEGVFEVKSTSGDTRLGGDDFDQLIIDWICKEFKKEQGIDLHQDRTALQRLKEAAEKAKCELSTAFQTEINLPFITTDAGSHQYLRITLTREKLERLTSDLLEKTLLTCNQAIGDARITTIDIDEVILVGQQTRMPAVEELVRKFFGKRPCKGINPAEAVAMGAAIQAGVLGGEVRNVLLIDVTPLTLSIETLGGIATALIERNTTIPTEKRKTFTTAEDNQPSVEIHVVQGERKMAADNKSLGKFQLTGLPPAPRGVPQIEVTFDLDENGILHVSAQDKATGREKMVTIIAPCGTGIFKEGLEEAQARNDAGAMLNKVEKSLSKQGDRLLTQVGSVVDSKVSALRTTLQGKNVTEIRHRTQELGMARQCIEALGESRDERAAKLLGELLMQEEDKSVREHLRKALRQIGGARIDEVLRPRTWVDKLLGRRRWVDK